MKKILVLICILSILPVYSYGASINEEKTTNRSIYSENIDEMNSFGLDTSLIVDKKEENGMFYYLYDYGEFSEYVNLEKNNMSTIFNIKHDDIKNEVIIYNDGDIYLNGHKVRVTFTDIDRVSAGYKRIYNTLKPQKPESKMLGCEYTTYVSGSENYKYNLNYYPDAKCQGTASKVVLYETFRVV